MKKFNVRLFLLIVMGFVTCSVMAQKKDVVEENIVEVGVYAPSKGMTSDDLSVEYISFETSHEEISKDINRFKKRLKSSDDEALFLKTTGYYKPSVNAEFTRVKKRSSAFCESVMNEISDKMNDCNCSVGEKNSYVSDLMKLHQDIKKQTESLNKLATKKLRDNLS